ncbi:MAG: radical SAM protein [Candidatus Parcubacteria bacterium]|nr:radical SAM protein [Candidatus Parcubacteria bacterium]
MPENKLELFITYKCNNDCVFCIQKDNRQKHKDLSAFKDSRDVFNTLSFYAQKGYKYINFLGGEPFIEDNFVDILQTAKKLNFTTALATNGFYLADKNIAQKALPLIDELVISIYGHNQKLFAKLSQNKQLYANLVKALKNVGIYFKGRLLKANCVINLYNYKDLLNIIKFINKNNIKEVNFTSMEILDHNKPYAVSFGSIKPVIKKVIEYGHKNKMIVRFAEVPFCLLGDDYYLADELFTMDRDIYDYNMKKEKPGRLKRKIKKCCGCNLDMICPGIDTEYLGLFGEIL